MIEEGIQCLFCSLHTCMHTSVFIYVQKCMQGTREQVVVENRKDECYSLWPFWKYEQRQGLNDAKFVTERYKYEL